MIGLGTGELERTEQVTINVEMNQRQMLRHTHAVGVILGTPGILPHVQKDDTLRLKVEFGVEYHNIIPKLAALDSILADPYGGITKGSLEEFLHHRCLIGQVLGGLDRMIRREIRR